MEDRLQWGIAAACFAITVVLRAEVALLFLIAGAIGVLAYGTPLKGRGLPALPVLAAIPPAAVGASGVPILGKLFAFFLKAGSLTFGSGLVIVPFLEQGLVRQTGWLDERQFLVAVAMGMLSPGPVVITATFVGYLVAGFWGAAVSTVGIFLPSFLLVLIVAPRLIRHQANPNLRGFVKGVYAAASLMALVRWKISNPVLVAAAAIVGVIGFSVLKPEWVFVK